MISTPPFSIKKKYKVLKVNSILEILLWVVIIVLPLNTFSQDFFLKYDRTCHYKPEKIDRIKLQALEREHFKTNNELAIPVVFHIVQTPYSQSISDKNIVEQLNRLNLDFSGTNSDIEFLPNVFDSVKSLAPIRFCLASINPEGEPTTGIVRSWNNNDTIGLSEDLYYSSRGGQTAWDTEKYLNVWVTSFGKDSGLAGFANGIHQNRPDEKRGVVISYNFFFGSSLNRFSKGRTLVHEIGHFLGLEHLWGIEGCEADDYVDDTPIQISPYNNCPTHPMISCSSEDMFMNFMDYVDDNCMVFFTLMQKERMLNILDIFSPNLLQTCDRCHDIIFDSDGPFSFKLYPNPNMGDMLHIEFSSNIAEASLVKQISIFNIYGELFYKKQHLIYSRVSIPLKSTFAPGVYLIIIGNKSSKLIIN